jgi:hypothetical protein
MQQYLLSVYQPDQGTLEPGALDTIMAEVGAWERDLKRAGAWVFTAGLAGVESATVVRAGQAGPLITDGPYAEGKEHVGGLSIITAPDLESALEWGRKLARAITLPVEVRAFQGALDDHLP